MKKVRFVKRGPSEEGPHSTKGGDIQKAITEAFPDTELHLPVVTTKGIEKASFAGPGTKLGERIRNLDVNSERAHNRETIPEADIITAPKSDMDHAAMYHDLRYHHAGKIAKNKKHLRQLKTKADLHLIKDNVINALNPLNGTVDRFTNAASIPAFLSKVAYESVIGKLKGEGLRL